MPTEYQSAFNINASKKRLEGLELAINKILCSNPDQQIEFEMIALLRAVYKDYQRHKESDEEILKYA